LARRRAAALLSRMTYVTPKKCETYELEENFLALSEDPEFFKSITVPDLDSFYWGGPARRLADEH
jgi:hypothetical protein